MWKKVEIYMQPFFFSGSVDVKLDDKNRFVLPQSMRYGLVEEGVLEFSICLGLGGCLAIYRSSDIRKIVEKFRKNLHVAKFQKFFTLFFSTLHHASCDKIGRVILPAKLKEAVKIKKEIVIAGVVNKIEIWAKDIYDLYLKDLIEKREGMENLQKMTEEAFSLLVEDDATQTSSS